SALAEGGDALGEARLAAGGLVLVDDARGRGLVDALHREPQRLGAVLAAGGGHGDRVLDAGAQLGAHRLVAEATLLVLLVALDLALDVRHGARTLLSEVDRTG